MRTTSPAQAPEREPSEDSNPPPGTYSSAPRRPIYQTETTGTYWTDVREAFKVCIDVDALFPYRLAVHPLLFVLTCSMSMGILVEIVAI